MPKQKQDYSKLKKEFFASKHNEVKSFITDKWLIYNSDWTKRTKWWAKEKKELKARATEKAIKQVWNKLAKQLEPSTEFLLWNIAKAIELTKVKLDQMEQKWNITNHLCKGGIRCKSEYQDRVNPHSDVMKSYWQ